MEEVAVPLDNVTALPAAVPSTANWIVPVAPGATLALTATASVAVGVAGAMESVTVLAPSVPTVKESDPLEDANALLPEYCAVMECAPAESAGLE